MNDSAVRRKSISFQQQHGIGFSAGGDRPSGILLDVSRLCFRHIQDPASQRLTWNKPPVNVLVIRKVRDESLVEPFKQLCSFLVEVQKELKSMFQL